MGLPNKEDRLSNGCTVVKIWEGEKRFRTGRAGPGRSSSSWWDDEVPFLAVYRTLVDTARGLTLNAYIQIWLYLFCNMICEKMPSFSESELQIAIRLCIEEVFSSVVRVHLMKFKCCQISWWCSLISLYICPPKKGHGQKYILDCVHLVLSYYRWLLNMRLFYVHYNNTKWIYFRHSPLSVQNSRLSQKRQNVLTRQVQKSQVNEFSRRSHITSNITLPRTCYFPILERTWGGGFQPPCHFVPNWDRTVGQKPNKSLRCSGSNSTRVDLFRSYLDPSRSRQRKKIAVWGYTVFRK